MSVFHANAIRRTGRVLAETPQFAMTTRESWQALTVISAHVVDTLAAVDTGFGQALVQIKLAILTLEARRTGTGVSAISIKAYAVVQARVRLTLVDIHVAVDTLIAEEKR